MKTRLRTLKTKGFALVATLSLMILLTLLAVGLLTLSTVTVRAGGREEAMATARANARLALMIALGELQRTMGPDTSVSAPAAAVVASASQPHLTGVWAGWHWDPTPSGSPTYSQKSQKFQRWLISTADPATAKQLNFASSNAPAQPNGVELVGNRQDSQQTSTRVIAEKVTISDPVKPGKYAWAVFDESTKAPIDLGDPKTPQTSGEEIASRNSPYRMRADILESEGSPLQKLKTPEKLFTLETAVLPVAAENADLIRKRFHDFTTASIGLLTDTAYGGLKRDLTSLFEESTLPTSGFRTQNSPYPQGFNTTDGAPTWAYLWSHYRKYKQVTASNGAPSYQLDTPNNEDFVVNSAVPVNPTPTVERLLPIIAKCQLVFSLVAHWPFDVPSRRNDLNQKGNPKDWRKYAVPDLVYDPVITLYNPYDVTLDLKKIRIRIWDPPVIFKFQRKGLSTTPNWENCRTADDGWARPAQLQKGFGTNTTARKCITLLLSDGTTQALTGSLQLKPGEVKVFSPRVETAWNWGVETVGGYGSNSQATFFDWDVTKAFGNHDHRLSASTWGKYGMECAPGWVTRAGLQPDHLAEPRNPTTRASWETNPNEGFITMRICGPDPQQDPNLSDEIRVEVKPQVAAGSSGTNFQVDLLAGNNEGTPFSITQPTNTGVEADTLRSYRFTFSDPNLELWNGSPISREFQVKDLLQNDTDMTSDFKKPFAMLELSARTTKDSYNDTKPWLYNNPVVEGASQATGTAGLVAQSYDLRLRPMSSWNSIPNGIVLDPATKRGYFGASGSDSEGSSFVTMLHVPTAPAASLGDLIPTNLVASSQLPRVVHPFGNSRAHPLLRTNRLVTSLGGRLAMDHSYLLNDALWDSYFFSSLTDYNTGLLTPSRNQKTVITELLQGVKSALNTRLVPVKASGDAERLANEISQLPAVQRAQQIAKHVAISGPFNVNSTSIDAWIAALSSLRDRSINGLSLNGDSLQTSTYGNSGKTPVVRTSRPLGDDSVANTTRWAAFRTLSDDNIRTLAKEIVAQIKQRGTTDGGPSMTLGEFVNRRIGTGSSLHATAGLLQTAIDNTDINQAAHQNDSKSLSIASVAAKRKTGLVTSSVLDGNSAEGAPTIISQGDLMQGLASIATVRGDTFKIRAYGEALEANGTTVLARAWCEAVVQRVPEFVDPVDAPEIAINQLTSQANKTFGRRFAIVSFRYLDEKEL
ncbi:MAG TPA: hypothetical protein VIM69_00475 [Opitutaceae bacterium]